MEEMFMREAVAAAAEGVSRGDGGPFGAVVVREGRVVARAWNRVIRDQDPTAHAEVNAIREACRVLERFHLEDCELYTSCEPCPMCLGAIAWSRIPRVIFGASRHAAAAAPLDGRRPPRPAHGRGDGAVHAAGERREAVPGAGRGGEGGGVLAEREERSREKNEKKKKNSVSREKLVFCFFSPFKLAKTATTTNATHALV